MTQQQAGNEQQPKPTAETADTALSDEQLDHVAGGANVQTYEQKSQKGFPELDY